MPWIQERFIQVISLRHKTESSLGFTANMAHIEMHWVMRYMGKLQGHTTLQM